MDIKKIGPTIRYTAMIGFTLLSLYATVGLSFLTHRAVKKHKEHYGSIEDSKYKATAEFPEVKTATYKSKFTDKWVPVDDDLEKTIETLRSNKEKIKEIIAKTGEMRQYFLDNPLDSETLDKILTASETLPEGAAYLNNKEHVKMTNKLSRYSDRLSLLSSNYFDLSLVDMIKEEKETDAEVFDLIQEFRHRAKTRKAEEEQYGDVRDYTRNLVEIICGKALPEEVSLDINDIDLEGAAGVANFLSQEIKSEDGSYARTLLILLHEAAHLMSSHQEEEYGRVIHPIFAERGKITVMEEAVSYAFMLGAAYFAEGELGDMMQKFMEVYSKNFIEEYFNGNTQEHREAMAIADAATTYFGDPLKAYNYLLHTRYEDIDEEIWEVLEGNMKEYHRKNRLKEEHKALVEETLELINEAEKENMKVFYDHTYVGKPMREARDQAMKKLEENDPTIREMDR